MTSTLIEGAFGEPPPPEDDHADGRTQPHDRNAEMAVIGAMLLDQTVIDDVWDVITAADFYIPAHELIYDAIYRRKATTQPVDTILVTDDLRANGQLSRVGGAAYLHACTQAVASPQSAGHYADIVRKTSIRRRLIAAGLRIVQDGYAPSSDDTNHLLEQAATYVHEARHSVPGVDDEDQPHPWAPVDLAAILDGDFHPPTATVLTRRDGKALLYPACVHSISGEPGSLKTWVAEVGIVQELDAGRPAAMIDFEDRADAVTARLLQLGANPDHLRDPSLFRYLRPDTALDAAAAARLDSAVAGCSLVVIDGVTEVMSIHGMSINDNDDVARFQHLLPRRIADQGPAVLQIDHVTKDSETRGRYAIGGQHKLAAITGTAMKAVVIRSGGKGEHAVVKIVIDKDKHGDVGPAGMTVAEFHLDATAPDETFAWLDHPTTSHDEDGHFRPTTLMQRVSDFLYATPHPASLNEIKTGVRGKASSIADAVSALVREGHVITEPGPNRTTLHRLVTVFEATS